MVMCCFQKIKPDKIKTAKTKSQKKYQTKIYPIPAPTFTIDETIQCFYCKDSFSLESNQIKIHCQGCNQFFHCNISGKCIGKNCKMTQGHQLSWCKSCVPDTSFNRKNDGLCICHECI